MKHAPKAATLLVVLILLAYILYSWEDFRSIRLPKPYYLVGCLLGHFSSLLTTGIINHLLFKRLGYRIPMAVTFYVGVLTAFSNLILPFKGGLATRALYLKKAYSFSYSDLAVTILGAYILIFLCASFTAMVGTLAILLKQAPSQAAYLTLAGASLIFAGCLMAICFPNISRWSARFIPQLNRMLEGWFTIRSQPKVLALLLGFSFVEVLNTAVTLGFTYKALGYSVSLLPLLVSSAVGNIAFFLGVTPGGLGFFEAAVAYTGALNGYAVAASMSAALISRFVLLAFLFIIGPLSVYRLSANGPLTQIPENSN